jgi:hypothetical protein
MGFPFWVVMSNGKAASVGSSLWLLALPGLVAALAQSAGDQPESTDRLVFWLLRASRFEETVYVVIARAFVFVFAGIACRCLRQ